MIMRSTSYLLVLTCTILTFVGTKAVWADELDSIRYGESALTYAAGSIKQSAAQDGVVNVITGDNQTTGDRMQLGQGDTLYLRLKNPGDAAVGDLYSIFKRTRKVFHPLTNQYLGYLVVRLAIARVTQVDKALTTVQVIRAYGAVSPGDPVVKFALAEEIPAAAGAASAGDVMGMVVELQADMGMTLVAQRNIVYVDKGREDGIQHGDHLEVVRSGGNLPSRAVGEIKILSTEDRTATALVTKSTSRILKGDRVRFKVRASNVVPVSQPVHKSESSQSAEPSMAMDPAPPNNTIHVQSMARETRITLNDLTKQLRYESGEATIQPEGQKVLEELVENLKSASVDQLIRVEGHADTMEIGPSLKARYPTNWDLSKARATGVLRYLVEKGGVDSARISSIGYGDTKPVVSNATEQGRQQNRRVDIVLYSPEPDQQRIEPSSRQSTPVDAGYKIGGLDKDAQDPAALPREQPSSNAQLNTAVVDPAAPVSPDSGFVAPPALIEPAFSDQTHNPPTLPQP